MKQKNRGGTPPTGAGAYPKRHPISDHTIRLIKSIINQDRRERYAAGYKQGTTRLAKRIAEAFGISRITVLEIKKGKRHGHGHRHGRLLQRPTTVEPEKLEQIRQERIRKGFITASWERPYPTRCSGSHHHEKRAHRHR